MEKIKEYAERAAPTARKLVVASFCIAMLGLFGNGYCEHEGHFSPTIPDSVRGYTNRVYFKGETRYVNDFDRSVCVISPPLAFSGVGAGILIGVLYLWLLRRLP